MFKGWKTLTFNILTAFLTVAEMQGAVDVIPAEYQAWFTLAVALANVGLRFVTTTPVGVSK